jgi:hypothetical protein
MNAHVSETKLRWKQAAVLCAQQDRCKAAGTPKHLHLIWETPIKKDGTKNIYFTYNTEAQQQQRFRILTLALF